MSRVSKDFILQEFVHPEIYNIAGERCKDWLSQFLIQTTQELRDEIDDPMTICDWAFEYSSGYVNSGLRVPKGDVGASFSAHKFGAAEDIKFKTKTTDEVFDEIMSHQSLYPTITRIENIEHTRTSRGHLGRDWLHIEVGVRHGEIYVFNP